VVATPNELHWKSPHPIEALLGAALTNNFDLRIRLAELEQQGFRVRLARNERWPGFKVGPQFSEENAGGQDRILGIGLSFPLPLWKQNSSNVELAQARQSQAESLLNSQRRDLEKRIISAARKYESRLAELQRWNPDSLNHFAEAAELADRHYRLAAVPATLYTELQKQYVDAMESLLDTRMDVIAAAAELEELTGLPTLPTP
jgi:cobalt-zinc-cadmium efflux system outer membrane protein